MTPGELTGPAIWASAFRGSCLAFWWPEPTHIEIVTGTIRLEGVYKIFGEQPRGRALELARAGHSKTEIQAWTDHVVGLADVNVDIRQGELFVIMGLSGSGKSTAIRTVNQLHSVTAGSVWVDDVDIQTLSGRALQAVRREKMGMVFQHFALFPHRNVIDNVAYGLEVQGVDKTERLNSAMEALSLVGLQRYAMSMPSQLSGGMQQRVGLARALASDPSILLMDEAFSALDPLIRRQMQDELMAIQQQLKRPFSSLLTTSTKPSESAIGCALCGRSSGADRYARRDPDEACIGLCGRVRPRR